MKTVKRIISVVWPIVYSKLNELTLKTETKFDDLTLQAVNTFVLEWLESEDDE